MNRKITYLHSGKIKTLQDTGTLPRFASGRGQHVYLLGFETYDFGRTYIGRLMMGDEIDSVVMTDVYLRNDGTVVATDDSGCEMTWNPNTGDASTEFVQHNLRRETWIDHLDDSVTIKLRFPSGAFVEMKGTYEADFQACSILIKDGSGTIELESAVIGDLKVQAGAILQADDIRVKQDKESGKTTINY